MAVDKNNLDEEALSLRFYKIVLSWDYLRLLKESDRKKGKGDDDNALVLKKGKNSYKDVQDYLATFEPLLFEEVKAQIIQGKKDDDEEETIWMKAVTVGCSEIDGFHFPMISCSDSESIQQNDLLLLSNKEFGDGKRLPTAYAFALVEDRRPDKIRLRMHLSGEVKQLNTREIEVCSRLLSMRPLVTENAKLLHVLKICSLSTIAREYVALRSVSSLPFKDLILSAADSNRSTEDHAWKISRPLKEFLESNHNKSQLDAINAGLSRKTFVLIQGPPGTGKTQTILGILSAILHATPARVHSNRVKLSSVKRGPELSMSDKYKHWGQASPWLGGINPLDQEMPIDGDDGFFPTSGNDLKPEVVNSSRKYRVRVLVCAPSNSALDEIVLRILNTALHYRLPKGMQSSVNLKKYSDFLSCAGDVTIAFSGIRDENDRAYSPKIVRIGLKAHHSVQAVSMDYLVEQRLSGMDSQIGDRQKQGGPVKDKDSIRASILDEAVIVFSTLSFSASPVFTKLNRGFDVVIIDEAAQAVEPSTLLPLSNGCKQVFLVGDPVQLPATVISPIAGKFGYCTSLFERLQRAGYPVQMLKTQYRMHPEIRNFPSREFYKEALEDGPDVEEQTKRSWHEYRCFGPFCFFDIHDGKESQPSGSGSWQNVDEVEFVLAMYHKLVSRYPELKSSSRLAIISPYRHQVKLLRQKFRETFGVESDKVVDINTVDGFQGREKDVAIFSCVRASKDKGIGFVADYRRMNVGITRARSSVLVVGSASTLRRDARWQNLVESAEKRNALHKVSKPYAEFFSQENLKLMQVEVVRDKSEAPPEDMDIEVSIAAEADQAPQDDWGYAGEEGGYDED
ncbi:hypothetical protein RDI58_003169 [Solanum bulbocastanum]|uniref:Helicase MAGATAMA 3 n=1 Tax=Solanum bulbocastanum TaxID=147425 RepID=A0AAN8U7Y6_SOLBU